ncbi:tetratricopeptide repeat protein [Azospirillum halopraeferens]|uniref:tetratricopeptide repeat protein n=1 Tax=Azospirillum halopraeferens TaxID=34010 RepID=UPI0004193A56|nr:tetratricopeptide repeat protein [Azospirillum halopraeferens]
MASESGLAAGRAALAAGRPAEAAALFRRALTDDPAAMAGWANLAGALRRAGPAAGGDAESALRRALAVEPQRAELHVNHANLLRAGGDCPAAAAAFRRALALRPDLPEGLMGAGLCAHDSGASGPALDAVRRALVLRPDHAEARVNLAALLTAAGRAEEAGEASAVAVRLRPADAGVWRDRATALTMLDRGADARAALRRSAALDPAAAATWRALARALRDGGDDCAAAVDAALRRTLRLDPADPVAALDLSARRLENLCWEPARAAAGQALAHRPDDRYLALRLADALNRAGWRGEAERWARRALRLVPEDADAAAILLGVLRDDGAIAPAAELGRRVSAAWPDNPRMLVNAAAAPALMLDWPTVERLVRRALRLDPGSGPAFYTLGMALKGQGRLAESLDAYDAAVRLAPEVPLERHNRAMTLLAGGRVQEGLEEFEWRWRLPDFPAGRRLLPQASFPVPVWQGESLAGRTLLVWAEQGVGDEIWDAGCLPAVMGQAERCIVECEDRLVPLFQRSFPAATVVVRTAPPDPATRSAGVQCPMGSLLRHVWPVYGAPAPGYLKPDAERTAELRRRYRRDGRPVVGIAWRSRKPVQHRSFAAPLRDWAPLLRLPDLHVVSLQYGDTEEDLAAVRRDLGVTVTTDATVDALKDLDGFAAQVAACDLVVSIANATIPMAHAVGRPAVAVLRTDQFDWRYEHGVDRPRWLPTVRVVRQAAPGDWTAALREAAGAAAVILGTAGTDS